MTKRHKDSMPKELAEMLNERKKKSRVQEEKTEEIDDETRRLRVIAKRIHDEDFPPEHWGVDLWNTGERERKRKEMERY